jgi:hypothetical protein
MQMLDGQECPWKEILNQPPAPGADVPKPSNRRRRPRHRINFNLELRDQRMNIPLRVNATDISGNGCYIESILPLPVGTNLNVEFWIDEERIKTNAIVRTCDPGVGMGIEFFGLTPEMQDAFQKHLEKLDPAGISGPAASKAET